MRLLSVFLLSLVVCLFGVLFAAFPELWMVSQPWQSPLVWGGAVVFSAWLFCVRSVANVDGPGSTVLVIERRRGMAIVMLAGVVTFSLMKFWIL